jgi:signal peptidase II
MASHDANEPQRAAGQPPARPAVRRAWRSPVAWATLVLVLGLVLTIDLWSKSFIFGPKGLGPVQFDAAQAALDPGHHDASIAPHRHKRLELLPWRLLDARLVWNQGAVFGIGQQKRVFFIGFTIVAISVGVLLFARWTAARQHLAHVAIGLILAGGLGNLYDRITLLAVRDFFHMLPDMNLPFGWRWPGGSPEIFPWVFNVADVSLLTGMALLMIHINRLERRRRKLERQTKMNDGDPAEPKGDATRHDAGSENVTSSNASPGR